MDRFRDGRVEALSAAAKHGQWLWDSKGGCWRCHVGSNFTDERYHNTGVSWGKAPPGLQVARIDIDPVEMRRLRADLPIVADSADAARALTPMVAPRSDAARAERIARVKEETAFQQW